MKQEIINRYWYWLKRLGITNLRVNRRVQRVADEVIQGMGLPFESLDLSLDEYNGALKHRLLASYSNFGFQHRKVLEYLVSVRLSERIEGVKVSKCDGLCCGSFTWKHD